MNNQPHQNEFLDPIIQHYNSLPPISRTWFSISLLITTLHTLDFFEDAQLVLLWHRLAPPHLELWRIITSFSWAGPGTLVDFPVLMLLYSLAVVVPGYERDPHDASRLGGVTFEEQFLEQHFRGRRRHGQRQRAKHPRSDCIFAFLICSLIILGSYLVLEETTVLSQVFQHFSLPRELYDEINLMPLFTRTLLYSIITLHSFQHPDDQVNINFFPVPGRYVPFFHVGFGVLMGYRINEMLHGIIVGFIYAFLVQKDSWLASSVGLRRLIYTPQWLIYLVGDEMHMNVVVNNATIARDARENNIAMNDMQQNDNNNHGIRLEPGANLLHRAAAIGDLESFQNQMNEVNSIVTGTTSERAIAQATVPFRQQDRNGWQPLHEAARGGHIDILKFLLEIEEVTDDNPGDENNNGGPTVWRRTKSGKLNVNVNARTNRGRGCTALWLVENEHGVDCEAATMIRAVGGVSLGYGDEADGEE